MSFGKFTLSNLLQHSSTFAVQVHTEEEFRKFLHEADKCGAIWSRELLTRYPRLSSNIFPICIRMTGTLTTSLACTENAIFVVDFTELEFNYNNEITTIFNQLNDTNKALAIAYIQKLKDSQDVDLYWYVNDRGKVCSSRISSNPHDYNDRLIMGNVYYTHASATDAVERIKTQVQKFNPKVKMRLNND